MWPGKTCQIDPADALFDVSLPTNSNVESMQDGRPMLTEHTSRRFNDDDGEPLSIDRSFLKDIEAARPECALCKAELEFTVNPDVEWLLEADKRMTPKPSAPQKTSKKTSGKAKKGADPPWDDDDGDIDADEFRDIF